MSIKIYQKSGTTYSSYQDIPGTWAVVNSDSTHIIVGNESLNAAKIYEKSGGTWSEVKSVTGSGDFGCSVAVAGDYAAVGAKNNGTGEVYVYYNSGTWNLIDTLTHAHCSDFGLAVRIAGTLLSVAMVTNDSVFDCGSLAIYRLSDSGATNLTTMYNFQGSNVIGHQGLGAGPSYFSYGSPEAWFKGGDRPPNIGMVSLVHEDENVLVQTYIPPDPNPPEPPPPTPSVVTLEEVFVVAKDLIKVSFDGQLSTIPSIYNVDNFTITGGTENVVIKSVLDIEDRSTSSVYLVVSGIQLGQTYTLFVNEGTLFDINREYIEAASIAVQWNRTKVDAVLATLPEFYSKKIGSNIRSFIEAVMISDEEIGGDF